MPPFTLHRPLARPPARTLARHTLPPLRGSGIAVHRTGAWATTAAVPPPRERLLRLAAGFVHTRDEAEALAHTLQRRFGLRRDQLLVLGPADSTPDRFAQAVHHWTRLRPPAQQREPLLEWLTAVAAGTLGGALLALGAQALGLADGMGPPELGVAALAIAVPLGVLVHTLVMPWRPSWRFDAALQRRLAVGQHAVVAQGLDRPEAAAAIAALQQASIYWCAEAPRPGR